MLGFPLGILSAAGAGGVAGGDYELIATEILTASQASVVFSSLATYASVYKHLQIRYTSRSGPSFETESLRLRINADTGSNYADHRLAGTGSSVVSAANTTQTYLRIGLSSANSAPASIFGAGVCDLLDAYSTTKNTTTRTLSGVHTSGEPQIRLSSGLYINTAAVSSITIDSENGITLSTGSRFSLYGIRG